MRAEQEATAEKPKAVKKDERRVLIGKDAKIIDLVQRITPTGYTQAMSFLTGKKRRK